MNDHDTRLVVELSRRIHYDIKRRALENRLTIKEWVLRAIAREMVRENELNDKQ